MSTSDLLFVMAGILVLGAGFLVYLVGSETPPAKSLRERWRIALGHPIYWVAWSLLLLAMFTVLLASVVPGGERCVME